MTKKLTTEQKLLNRIWKLRNKLQTELVTFQTKKATLTQAKFSIAFNAYKKLTDLNPTAK